MKLPKLDTHDILFVSGSTLIVIGTSIHHPTTGVIIAGCLLLIAPVLEIVSGFIRGLRS